MKTVSFTILGILLIAASAFSQERKNHAKNVKKQISDEKVFITYDLPAKAGISQYKVCLNIKDRIKNIEIEPGEVIGTGDNLSSGVQLKIDWAYPADGLSKGDVGKFDIRVLAIDPNSKIVHKNAIIVGAGFGLAGLTVSAIGIIKLSQNSASNTDYKIYKSNSNPYDPIWQERGYSDRQDLYDTINDEYKNGQILTIGGVVILGVGTFIVTKLIKNNKIRDKEKKSLCFYPIIEPNILANASFSNTRYGLGITYKFR